MNYSFYHSKYNYINVINKYNLPIPSQININIHGLGSSFQFNYQNNNYQNNLYNYQQNLINNNILDLYLELPSHGKSSSSIKCYFDSISDFIDVIHQLVLNLQFNHPNAFINLIGNSFGASLCIYYSIYYPNFINKVILISPLIKIKDELIPNCFTKNLLILLSKCYPTLPLISVNSNFNQLVYPNKDYLLQKQNDYYDYNYNHRLITGINLLNLTKYIQKYQFFFDKTILIIHNINDPINDIENTLDFYFNIFSYYKFIITPKENHHSPLYSQYYNHFDKIINLLLNKYHLI